MIEDVFKLTVSERKVYCRSIADDLTPDLSEIKKQVLVGLMEAALVKCHSGIDQQGNQMTVALLSSLSDVSLKDDTVFISPRLVTPLIINQKGTGVGVVVIGKKANDGVSEFSEYIKGATGKGFSNLPSLPGIPSLFQDVPSRFSESTPIEVGVVSPVVNVDGLFDTIARTFSSDISATRSGGNESTGSLSGMITKVNGEIYTTSLSDFLSEQTGVDGLGTISKSTAKLIVDAVGQCNSSTLNHLKVNVEKLREENRIGFNSGYDKLPAFAKNFIQSTFDDRVANNRFNFMMSIAGYVKAYSDNTVFSKTVTSLLGIDRNNDTDDWTARSVNKIDKGEFPLSIVKEQFNLPSISSDHIKKAIGYFQIQPTFDRQAMQDAIALSFVPPEIIGKKAELVYSNVGKEYAHTQEQMMAELVLLGLQLIDANHNPIMESKLLEQWRWLSDPITRKENISTLFLDDIPTKKTGYEVEMCQALNTIDKYAMFHDMTSTDDKAVGVIPLQQKVALRVSEGISPLVTALNDSLKHMPLIEYKALNEKLKHQANSLSMVAALRTHVVELPYPQRLPAPHKLGSVQIGSFTNVQEALNAGVNKEMAMHEFDQAGDMLFKVSDLIGGSALGAISLSVDSEYRIAMAQKAILEINSDPDCDKKNTRMTVLKSIENNGNQNNKDFFNACQISPHNAQYSVNQIRIFNPTMNDVVQRELAIFVKKLNASKLLVGLSDELVNVSYPAPVLNSELLPEISSMSELPFHGLAGVVAACNVSWMLPDGITLQSLVEKCPEGFRRKIEDAGLLTDTHRLMDAVHRDDLPLDVIVEICASRGISTVEALLSAVEKAPELRTPLTSKHMR